jgi:hypothetical protein
MVSYKNIIGHRIKYNIQKAILYYFFFCVESGKIKYKII